MTQNEALSQFKELLGGIKPVVVGSTLLIVFLLMFANWFFEVLKWRFLCSRFQYIRLRTAIESVLCGLSWAVFTPNRIGEYGGRVLFLKPRKRVFGVIGMLIGAIAQMVITNVIGVIALCWFIGRYLDLDGMWYVFVVFLSSLYALFFFLLYFNIRLFHRWLLKIKYLKKFSRVVDLLLRYNKRDLSRVFFYSIARYVIFTSQYCILMQVVIPDLPFAEMVLMIFILFFIQSALPSLDLLDVGVRSVTASFFFSYITTHTVAVMAIAAYIWLVNLIIPAIIGSVFTFKINFFGARNN